MPLTTPMRRLLLLLPALLLGFLSRPGAAQSLPAQPTPFSVWLDFEALRRPGAASPALPIWLESVTAERPRLQPGEDTRTVYRLRLRRMGTLQREVQMRVFFEDLPGAAPSLTGWTETGTLRYVSGQLGSGLGLLSSESLTVPVAELDYLDLAVPGDGSTVRGLFLATLKRSETRLALDFGPGTELADPFGALSTASPAGEDSLLLGRVRAVLEPGPVRLTGQSPVTWEFEIERVPDLAVLTVEILQASVLEPPVTALNGHALGPLALLLPDLADPAFRGETVPRSAQARFHYTGWVRAQLVIPGALLQRGSNELNLVLPPQTSAVALRRAELQLKFPAASPRQP